ncbi:hypothetical protein QF050_001097 [Arthrobacter sp. SLBN-112]|nr:hypothetical protein [Arthrobacter sp. SLBN-112]
MVAESVVSRMPLAMPCSTRATRSMASESATRKAVTLHASRMKAALITGLRPRWSEMEPKTSRAASNATA